MVSQYRYYYNFEKRINKGRNTANNSANYISFIGVLQNGKYSTSQGAFIEDIFITIGPTWGFQRTYKRGFNFSLDLGLGYSFNNSKSDGFISPLIDLQIGWILKKKK